MAAGKGRYAEEIVGFDFTVKFAEVIIPKGCRIKK